MVISSSGMWDFGFRFDYSVARVKTTGSRETKTYWINFQFLYILPKIGKTCGFCHNFALWPIKNTGIRLFCTAFNSD